MSSTERSARLRRARASSAAARLCVHLRVGGPALGAQILGALLGGARLRQHAGGGAEFGLGLLGLQLQIDFVEGGERLADIDGLADFDQALCDLAGNPEAHVGLDPGPDGADEAALRRLGLVMHGGDQNRTARGGRFGRLFVAAGQREHRKGQRRSRQEPVIARENGTGEHRTLHRRI